MVLDLKARDTEALGEIELELGDNLAAFVPQRPVGVEFPIETGSDRATVFEARRNRVRQRPRQFFRQSGTGRNGSSRVGKRNWQWRLKDLGDPKCRIQPVAYGGQITRCAAVQ